MSKQKKICSLCGHAYEGITCPSCGLLLHRGLETMHAMHGATETQRIQREQFDKFTKSSIEQQHKFMESIAERARQHHEDFMKWSAEQSQKAAEQARKRFRPGGYN